MEIKEARQTPSPWKYLLNCLGRIALFNSFSFWPLLLGLLWGNAHEWTSPTIRNSIRHKNSPQRLGKVTWGSIVGQIQTRENVVEMTRSSTTIINTSFLLSRHLHKINRQLINSAVNFIKLAVVGSPFSRLLCSLRSRPTQQPLCLFICSTIQSCGVGWRTHTYLLNTN